MFSKRFSCWTNLLADITLDTSSGHMFRLNMVDHISTIGAGIVTFTTLERSRAIHDNFWFNDVIQASKSISIIPYILRKVNRFIRSMMSKYVFSKRISGWTWSGTDMAQDQRVIYNMVCLNVDTNVLTGFGDMQAVNALVFRATQNENLWSNQVVHFFPSWNYSVMEWKCHGIIYFYEI